MFIILIYFFVNFFDSRLNLITECSFLELLKHFLFNTFIKQFYFLKILIILLFFCNRVVCQAFLSKFLNITLNSFLNGPLIFVLAKITPSRVYVRYRALIYRFCISLTKLEKHLTCKKSTINPLGLNSPENFSP
mgnify:CR=1 FL=1